MKLEIPQQLFEIYSNIKCPKNPSSKSRVFSPGRRDRHGEANSRFSQFYELPYARYQLANKFQLTTYSTPNIPKKRPDQTSRKHSKRNKHNSVTRDDLFLQEQFKNIINFFF